ncbi:recombinase family protein [Sphingosinicellaceae bacterium]|nr:recombinase family protein [Sphingosinicellaceae bacterium]
MGVLALGDEYTSRETAKHVSRAMLANAEAGFSNGQRPPIGYVAVEAERRGQKIKKKFAINEAEASVVRTLYDLYLKGSPADGRALGVTSVASELNRRGLRYRGHPFAVSNVHFVLTNTAYRGVAYYNKRCSTTLEQRPESDWIGVPVPAIITEADWYAVQAKLRVSNPRKTPPRVVSGPTVLIGLAICGCDDDGCKGGMTISTGKSGAYKYYACSRRARMGTTACAGRRISMPVLDELVMKTLTNAVLSSDRLPVLLAACLDQSEAADVARTANLKSLRTQKTGADAMLGGLYRTAAMIETGIDNVMKGEIESARGRIATLASEINLVEQQFSCRSQRITPEILERFGILLRQRLSGTNSTVRQSYARLLIDRVEVGRQRVRIVGSKTALASCVAATDRHPNEVPSFERRWCTGRDSNP